jgi:hypothetical protein
LDEVEIDQVEFDANIIKDTLSPDLWSNGELNSDIRKKLLRAAKVYYDYVDLAPVKLKDIVITGSIANYNYHDLSDIDVHLIVDYSAIDDNVDLVGEFLATKKALWGEKHNIKIKGHDLEFYIQDATEEHHSTGIFSLVKNDWNIKPSRQDSLQVDAGQVRKKSADFMNRIEHVTEMAPSQSQIDAIDLMKEKIKTLRQAGLNSEAQEFSVENLVFKILRNTGYLQMLSDAKLNATDLELSLDEKADDASDFATTKHKGERDGDDMNTLMVQDGINGMNDKKVQIIKDFISFTRDKLGLEEPVKVGLRKGRDEYIQTTASYLPYENENYVRCEGRALVDILRSIGHELTHNRQRELGIFNPGDDVPTIGYHIEDQANAIAGILIKDFAMNHGYDMIYEIW